jgi:hypothetical protein
MNPKAVNMRKLAVIIITLLMLSGCGGGGSSSGVSIQPQGTIITGAVAKGLFTSGTVTCYLVSGATLRPYGSAPISSTGKYTLDIGQNTGIIILEVTSGNYLDETKTAPNNSSPLTTRLRTALVVTQPGGTIHASITPLTELAVRKAEDSSPATPPAFTSDNINAANSLLSDIFPFNVVTTEPLPLNSLSGATAEQECYSFVLAGIAQYGLATFLSDYQTDLRVSPYRITLAHYNALVSATQTILNYGYPRNPTSYTSTTQIRKFDMVGWYTTTVTISTQKESTSPYSIANLIQFALLLELNSDNSAKFLIDTIDGDNRTPETGVITPTTTDQTTTVLSSAVTHDVSNPVKTVLNVSVLYQSGITAGLPNATPVATIKLKTKPGVTLQFGDINVKHIYQGNTETTAPFATINDATSTDARWIINALY